jgi:hypothetical protein
MWLEWCYFFFFFSGYSWCQQSGWFVCQCPCSCGIPIFNCLCYYGGSCIVRHLLAQRSTACLSPHRTRFTLGWVHPLVSYIFYVHTYDAFSSPCLLTLGHHCFTWHFRRVLFAFSSDFNRDALVSHRYKPPSASFACLWLSVNTIDSASTVSQI